MASPPIVLVVNGRIPGPRAHSIATVRTAAALHARGQAVEVWAPWRLGSTEAEPHGRAEIEAWYGITEPIAVRYLRCLDLVDVLPRAFQRLSSPLLAHSFTRAVMRRARRALPGTRLVLRDCALWAPAAKRGLRWIAEVHELPERPLARSRSLAALESAEAVMAISACGRRALGEDGLRRGDVGLLPSAAPAAWLARGDARARARAALGISRQVPVVCYAGQLYRWKDPQRLAAAAARLPQVRFRVVGGLPADRKRLALARRSDNLQLLGFSPPAGIARELAAADVAVLTLDPHSEKSRRFASPLKLFEALAVGTPLVAPDLPPVRELVAAGEAALLHPADDPAEPARSIERLLGDPELARGLAERGRSLARRYTYDERARRLAEVLEAVSS